MHQSKLGSTQTFFSNTFQALRATLKRIFPLKAELKLFCKQYTAQRLKILTERVGGGVGQVADGRRQGGIVQQDATVRRRVGGSRVGAGRVEVVVSVARVGQTQQVSQVLPALFHAHRPPIRHAALHTQQSSLRHN